jgi:sialic acid synthase SpsE
MEDKESNIQDFEDKDWDDNEDFKEETNSNVVDGLHVPHDEMEGVQKGNKDAPSFVEIGSPSTPLDEPNITIVEKALRPRYALKSQDIIGIDVDKYSCSTNSMNNSLNSMSCSNNDHVDRLNFLENEKEETFMFEQINLTYKEPLPNDELSAMYETYASFVYTLTCCYNSHVVFIMDAYVYNKFCKSRSCFALGQADDLKEAHVGKGPIFTNHVDKVRIMKR